MTRPNSTKLSCFLLWRFWLVATVALCHVAACQNSTDSITRDIRAGSGAVWLDDRFHLTTPIHLTGDLLAIYNEVLSNGASSTRLPEMCASLLKSERLELGTRLVRSQGNVIDIQLLSMVRFESNGVVKLHLLPGLEGAKSIPDSADGHTRDDRAQLLAGRVPNELLVIPNGELFLLYFPDLGSGEADLGNFERLTNQFERYWKTQSQVPLGYDRQYMCTITSGGQRLVLLDWMWSRKPPPVEKKALLQISAGRQLSENDLITLCTGMKLAKSGFYLLSN